MGTRQVGEEVRAEEGREGGEQAGERGWGEQVTDRAGGGGWEEAEGVEGRAVEDEDWARGDEGGGWMGRVGERGWRRGRAGGKRGAQGKGGRRAGGRRAGRGDRDQPRQQERSHKQQLMKRYRDSGAASQQHTGLLSAGPLCLYFINLCSLRLLVADAEIWKRHSAWYMMI